MAITINTIIDKIEVTLNGIIQVRQVMQVLKDDVQIAESFDRWTLTPNQDINDQTPQVQAVCNAVWTQDVISAYQSSIQTNNITGA
jgi:hypothetical protein